MNSDLSHPPRSRQPDLPLVRRSLFSYIALWLAMLMIVPVSLVAGVARDAHADGPNFTCEIICTNNGDNTFSCAPDADDPDCSSGGITAKHICNCVDGTVSEQDLNTSCDGVCTGHGGVCGIIDCFVPPPDDPIEIAALDFFSGSVAPLRIWAFNPDTNTLVFDKFVNYLPWIVAAEIKAVNEVVVEHGLPAADKPLVRIWARDRVRAQILTNFTEIVSRDTARTEDEQRLYDFMTYVVWKKRLEVAQNALDQFRAWDYAVNFAKCDWESPSKRGIYQLGTKPDGSLGSVKVSEGCSPGADGVPGNDPTPNSGSIDDVLAGIDDGETCFNLPDGDSFIKVGTNDTPGYDALTRARCAGVPNQWDVGLAAHPSIEHFLEYGLTIARKHQIITPGVATVLGNTFKEESLGIGLGVAGLAGIAQAARIYLQGGWKAYSKVIAPFSARAALKVGEAATKTVTGLSTKAVSAIAAGFIVFEVIGNIVTAVLTLIDIIEYNALGPKLKEVVRASYGETETSVRISDNYSFKTGKPDLHELIKTDAGKDEIRFALLEAMGTDKDQTASAPQRDADLFWAQEANGTPISTPPLNTVLHVNSWDANKPFEKVTVGLHGGWFVHEVTAADGTVTRALSLGIDYKDCAGKQRRAWRYPNETFVTIPMGLTLEDFDVEETDIVDDITYQSFDAGKACLTARINHAPSSSGMMISGTQSEGQSLSFSSTGTDPDGDAFSPAWVFGDGGTGSGSPASHTYADDGAYTVKVTAADEYGATGNQSSQGLSIANALPVIGTITGPTGRVELNTTVNLSAPFSDAGTADTHEASFDWGDGTITTGNVQESGGSGTATSSHAYTSGGTYGVKVRVIDDDGGAQEKTFSLTVNKRLSALDPAQVWIGMANSDNAGMRLDAQAEVLLNGTVVGTGQLLDFKGGSSNFANAVLQSIPLALSGTPEVGVNASLAVRLGVRATCALGGSRAGKVRFWYDGQPIDSGKPDAGSRIRASLETDKTTFFLRSGTPLALSTTAGTAKQFIDVQVDSKAKCPSRPFSPIGTWSVTIP